MGRDAAPCIPAVFADPQRTGRRTHCETTTGGVDVQSVTKDDVVAVMRGQALAERLERVTAVAGAGNYQPAVHRDAAFVLDAGNEPCRVGIFWVHHDREAECGWLYVFDLFPRMAAVGRAEGVTVGVSLGFR